MMRFDFGANGGLAFEGIDQHNPARTRFERAGVPDPRPQAQAPLFANIRVDEKGDARRIEIGREHFVNHASGSPDHQLVDTGERRVAGQQGGVGGG